MVARAQVRDEPVTVDLPEGHTVEVVERPVRRAAVYVPGGRAPYPSTVVMGAVTARAAGVEEIVVCAPPGPGARAHPVILAACVLCEVTEVYRMGGAQAIAALAHGTQSVAALDLLAQAEHGEESPLWLLSPDPALLEAVRAAVERLAEARPSAADAELAL